MKKRETKSFGCGEFALTGRYSDRKAQLTVGYSSVEFRNKTLGRKFNLIMTSVQLIVERRTMDKIAKGQKPHSHCYCKGVPTWLEEISLGKEIQSSQKRRKIRQKWCCSRQEEDVSRVSGQLRPSTEEIN